MIHSLLAAGLMTSRSNLVLQALQTLTINNDMFKEFVVPKLAHLYSVACFLFCYFGTFNF